MFRSQISVSERVKKITANFNLEVRSLTFSQQKLTKDKISDAGLTFIINALNPNNPTKICQVVISNNLCSQPNDYRKTLSYIRLS